MLMTEAALCQQFSKDCVMRVQVSLSAWHLC